MEPNTMAYLQYLTWSIDQLQTDAATDITTITTGDLTADMTTTGTAMIGTLTGGSGEGLEDTLLAVDDPGDSVILTIGDAGQWETVATISLYNEDYIEIPSSLKCQDNQFLTIKDHIMVCKDYPAGTIMVPSQPITIIREVPMWTISNLLVVAIVAAVVFKLMPKLTLRNFFKAVWKLVIRPFKRKEQAISDEWSKAEFETRDK